KWFSLDLTVPWPCLGPLWVGGICLPSPGISFCRIHRFVLSRGGGKDTRVLGACWSLMQRFERVPRQNRFKGSKGLRR
uniref:Uncharacterized protein n=1 Tax=Oryzias latipes TaxID=8090 RepID=A0A3P9L4H0_ORYLA